MIPTQIGHLTKLERLSLATAFNKYEPALPAYSFQRLTNLERCVLSYNSGQSAPYFTCETDLYPYNDICHMTCIEHDCQGYVTVDQEQMTHPVETFKQSGYW